MHQSNRSLWRTTRKYWKVDRNNNSTIITPLKYNLRNRNHRTILSLISLKVCDIKRGHTKLFFKIKIKFLCYALITRKLSYGIFLVFYLHKYYIPLIIKMGHRKKHGRSASSNSSSYDLYKQSQVPSSSPQSSSQSSSSPQKGKYRRLSKKELKKLIELERKIEKEEAILKRIRQKKAKSISKKCQTKRQIQTKEQKNQQVCTEESDKKKLFITGISEKYSYEEVMDEMGKILKNIAGVTGFRIKRKQGCPTYAFVDFSTHDFAKQGKQKLRSKRLFGEKMVIYYSQDEKKINIKLKQCFQCQGFGHFARECQKRKAEEEEAPQQNKTNDMKDKELGKLHELETNDRQCVKIEENLYEKAEQASKRVVRDKFRLSRLLGQN